MAKQYVLGSAESGSSYYLMGLDIKEKKLGVPLWGWGVAAVVAAMLLKKKRR